MIVTPALDLEVIKSMREAERKMEELRILMEPQTSLTPAETEFLLDNAHYGNREVRGRAAYVLSVRQIPAEMVDLTVTPLTFLVEHDWPYVGQYAARALGKCPKAQAKSALPALRAAIDTRRLLVAPGRDSQRDVGGVDWGPNFRASVTLTLGILGEWETVSNALRDTLKNDPAENVRRAAIGAMLKLNSFWAEQDLIRALEDKEPQVRATVALAITDLVERGTISASKPLLAKMKAYAAKEIGRHREFAQQMVQKIEHAVEKEARKLQLADSGGNGNLSPTPRNTPVPVRQLNGTPPSKLRR